MKNVKIYIYTSIKTLKRNNGAAGYVLSYTTQNNKEATLSKIEYLTNMTNHESELGTLKTEYKGSVDRDICGFSVSRKFNIQLDSKVGAFRLGNS